MMKRILLAATLLFVAGCTSGKPTAPVPAPPTLIDDHYPRAAAGDEGWEYHHTALADLDGDGEAETLTVIANIRKVPGSEEFAYDDGHVWQVYVTEQDGQRTDLFRGWVQLGLLKVMLGEAPQDVIILQTGGAGVALYSVDYQGPGQSSVTVHANLPVLNHTAPSR